MSLKILHLTLPEEAKLAILASDISALEQMDNNTFVHFKNKPGGFVAEEPYETVLRLWADALSE